MVLKMKSAQANKKKLILLMFYGIALMGLLTIMNFCGQKKIEVIFVIDAKLKSSEPEMAEVYINDIRKGTLLGSKSITISETYKVREILTVRFRKAGWKSTSDFSYEVKSSGNVIIRTIEFEKMIALPPPSTESKISLEFISDVNLRGIKIYRDDQLIGETNASGRFEYNTTVSSDERSKMSFHVKLEGVVFETIPKNMSIQLTGADIRQQYRIIPSIQNPPTISLKLINQRDGSPLDNVTIGFSDSQEKITTNNQGILQYQIQEARIGKQISISIIDPPDLVIISGYQPITIYPGMDNNIQMDLLCKVSMVIKITVQDLSNNPLSEAIVEVDGRQYQTNHNGNCTIPIDQLKIPYTIKVSKLRFESTVTNVIPTTRICEAGIIKLRGITGIITVQDLITSKPVPFVDIYERGVYLGQTDVNGRKTLSIYLNTPMTLEFRPTDSGNYPTRIVTVTFNKSSDLQIIKLEPYPYLFNFAFTNDNLSPLEGVQVKYKDIDKKSGPDGKLSISTHDINQPSGNVDNTFFIQYKLYKSSYKPLVTDRQKVYNFPQYIISDMVNIQITTVPPGGNIDIFDNSGKNVLNGKSPVSGSVEPGIYKVVAVLGDFKSITNYTVSSDTTIQIISDPIAQILSLYSQTKYADVVQIYDKSKGALDKKNSNYCEALNDVFKSAGHIKNNGKAAQVAELMVTEQCVSKDPYFFYNLASIYYGLSEWKKADDYFEQAYNQRTFFSPSDVLQKGTDCLYFRVLARTEIIKQGGFESNEAKCTYLQDTQALLDRFKNVALSNGLNLKNTGNLNANLYQEKKEAGCGQ